MDRDPAPFMRTSSMIRFCSAVVIGTRSSSSRRSTTRPISTRRRSRGIALTRSMLSAPTSFLWISDFTFEIPIHVTDVAG